MKYIFSFCLLLLSSRVWGEAVFVPATRLTPSVRVEVQVNSTGSITYRYTLFNAPSSSQAVESFYIDAPAGIPTVGDPSGWKSLLSDRPSVNWGARSLSALIQPGESLGGYSITSDAAPGLATVYIRGNAPLPSVDAEDELDNLPPIPDTYDDSVRQTHIGASTFTVSAPSSAIDRLISLKHQAASLGWLGNEKFVLKLDTRLDQAKDALARNKKKLARVRLIQFVHELEHAREEREDEPGHDDHHDKGRDDHHREKFVSDEAFQLLQINADFIIAKLPEKAKDRGEEDECRRAESEKSDDRDTRGNKDDDRRGGKEHGR